MNPPSFTPQVLNSDELPETQRLELIRDYYGHILMGVDIDPSPAARLRINTAALSLPNVMIVKAHTSPLIAARTKSLLADGNEDVHVTVSTSGYRVRVDNGEPIEVKPGEVVTFPLGRKLNVKIPATAALRTVQIPRAILAPLTPDFDDTRPHILSSENGATQLLFNYTEALHQQAAGDGSLYNLVGEQLLDLAALAVGATRDVTDLAMKRGVPAARLNAIKSDVRRNIEHPDLSISSVAARHGVSVRYVHMLFESQGVSFSEFVQAERLSLVQRELSDPRNAYRRIADIAFGAGFADLSTFNRAFRRRYDLTPSEWRQKHVLAVKPR